MMKMFNIIEAEEILGKTFRKPEDFIRELKRLKRLDDEVKKNA